LLSQVLRIEEEEYCSIPMGGVLPTRPQRIVGVGGTAGMVHPSTGTHYRSSSSSSRSSCLGTLHC
jgi:hypothetical protein